MLQTNVCSWCYPHKSCTREFDAVQHVVRTAIYTLPTQQSSREYTKNKQQNCWLQIWDQRIWESEVMKTLTFKSLATWREERTRAETRCRSFYVAHIAVAGALVAQKPAVNRINVNRPHKKRQPSKLFKLVRKTIRSVMPLSPRNAKKKKNVYRPHKNYSHLKLNCIRKFNSLRKSLLQPT